MSMVCLETVLKCYALEAVVLSPSKYIHLYLTNKNRLFQSLLSPFISML